VLSDVRLARIEAEGSLVYKLTRLQVDPQKMAVLDTDTVAAKLREFTGNMAAVGRALGVTRQAVAKYVSERPELQALQRELREAMKDDAEHSLHKAILAGEGWAVCFFLKTQARERGYVTRQEAVIHRRRLKDFTDDELLAIAEGSCRGTLEHPPDEGRNGHV
jgi:predicted transcriptional regulator